MRITNQWKYSQTVYDYQRGMKGVQKHQMQLSSGLKIQNPYEGASTYNDAMRLDYEITTLKQSIEATSKSQNFSKNSDKTLQEFSKQLERFKTKLVQAASSVHSRTSLEAIANDLEGIKSHLMNLANTSINGQFLFSGSALNTKPITPNGKYQGNGEQMKTLGGSKVRIPYNLDGKNLFLGKDNDYRKLLTSNVKLSDQTKPDAKDNPKYLNGESKINNLVGLNYVKDKSSINHDYDFIDGKTKFPKTYFYLQGRKSDGTTFTSKFSLTSGASMQSLLDKIGTEFGNTANTKLVDVTINKDGQINVKDLTRGAQTLDMQLVGATEQVQKKDDLKNAVAHNQAGTSPASVDSMQKLEAAVKSGKVHVTEFSTSNFKDTNGKKTDVFDYDNVKLSKKDNILTGNISQVNRNTGEYATDSTRLSEVAGSKKLYPPAKEGRYNIDNKTLNMQVKSKGGSTYNIKMSMGQEANPSAVPPVAGKPAMCEVVETKNGVVQPAKKFPIWRATEFGQFKTNPKDLTYRQLCDVVAMAASDNIPKDGTYAQYNKAVEASKSSVETKMNLKGQLQVIDKTKAVSDIDVSIYNKDDSGKFDGDITNGKQKSGSTFSFMENNLIPIDEPSINMFKDLQKMIDAVRNGYFRSDSKNKNDPRNTGIQGGIKRIDHLMDHINKEKVKIGSYTNLLKETNKRASIMKINVASVKSEVIDADYAKTYLSLTQKMMSYQAMLQATSKINQLSLLNYM